MNKPPSSLTSLCVDAVKQELLQGDDLLSVVFELPSNLFDVLVSRSPPLVLEKLQVSIGIEDRDEEESNYDDCGQGNGRKRRRSSSNFDKSWRNLFELRWPERVNEMESADWQQMYWEAHLQSCLDDVTEIALLPSFRGCLGEIKIPESTLVKIGLGDRVKTSTCDYSKLSYHFQEFGKYAKCLRLHSVLCGQETSHLLRTSKVQSFVLSWIRSEEQIGGLCQLLSQNCESLLSIEFIHCKFSSNSIDKICDSLIINSVRTHRIQNFTISTSNFQQVNPISLPRGLVSFLSSGRSLCSLKFIYNHLGWKFANSLFDTLCHVSSSVTILDLSENNITGWLSYFNQGPSNGHPTPPGPRKSLESLRVLNIRGNNLNSDDAVLLKYALAYLPNLEFLDISDNPIEDDGIRNILPFFVEASDRSSQFAELQVENCELSVIGLVELIDTLSTLKTPLKSLSIADNVVGSQVASSLGTLLATPIKVLNMSGIGMGTAGFLDLQKSLIGQLKLVKINLSKNRGGFAAAEFVSTLLSCATELVHVNLAYNFMPFESTNTICSVVKALRGNLEFLDLSGNITDSQTTRILAEFKRIGKPTVVLFSSFQADAPHDDDP